MSRQRYDVAVVGAGPAGSTAARIIAEKGHSVIVLERRRAAGRPVQCGEFVPARREIEDMFPRSPRMAQLVEVPPSFVINKTSRIRLVSPREHTYDFAFYSNIIDRASYDAYLAATAVDAGAELALSSTVVSRDSRTLLRVRAPSGTRSVSARVIVGADGPVSIISQSMGNSYGRQDRDLSSSLHRVYSNVDVDPGVVEMVFGGRAAPGGYGWIIPRGDREANVGIGIRRSLAGSDGSLRGYLHHITSGMKRNREAFKNRKVLRSVGGLIPIGGPVRHTALANAVVAGDAAGHVMSTNGGGIPTALCGGHIAGEVVSRHLEDDTSLELYEERWKREFGSELRTSLAALRLADKVMWSDSLTEVGMTLMGARFLEPIIRCRLPLPSGVLSAAAVFALSRLFS
jgi:digeranylgeranylglycerophospholipid reductase